MNRFCMRWWPWLLLGVCLTGLGGYGAFRLDSEYRSIGIQENERLTTQSRVVEDNLTRELLAINLSLESIIAELPGWQGRVEGRSEGMQHLHALRTAMSSVRTLVVVDAMGVISLSNREELVGRNFVLRDFFQAPVRPWNRGTLYISAPVQTPLGDWAINLSRVVLDARGEFSGLVSATLDPPDVRILLGSVRYADDMRVVLLHGDGTLFVIEPEINGAMGKNLSITDSLFNQHLKNGLALSYITQAGVITGDQRMAVLRTIQPRILAMDKALIVGVSRNVPALFGKWRNDAQSQLTAYLLLVLLSSAVLMLFRRQGVRQRVNAKRLKVATEATGVGIWEFELANRRNYWDATMYKLFGLDPRSGNERGDDWHQLLLPGELDRIKEATRAVLRSREPFELTFQLRRPDGEKRFMYSRALLQSDDPGGAPRRLIGTAEDVTERRRLDADLRIAATAFDCQEAIAVTDANRVILRVNSAFTRIFGYTAQEAVGATPRLLQSGRHDQAFYADMTDALQRRGVWQGEIWNRHKDGEVFPLWLSISAVRNEEGQVTHYVGTQTDIRLRKAEQDAIRQLAFHDPLTQLPNRRLLDDRLQQALMQARRDQKRLALMFIDLDNFKPVNDDFGHQAGDQMLEAVARRLQACVRESDTVARIGGDEFVVLLSVVESAQDALAVAEKISLALLQPFTLLQGQSVCISSSAGVAIYPEHGLDATELTKHADAAMYQAKAAGRDRVMLFQVAEQKPNWIAP